MKNLTLDEFKKIHEDWKTTGLSVNRIIKRHGPWLIFTKLLQKNRNGTLAEFKK